MGRIIISQYICWKNNISKIKQNHCDFTPLFYMALKNEASKRLGGVK